MLDFKISEFSELSHIEVLSKIDIKDLDVTPLPEQAFEKNSSFINIGINIKLSTATIDKIIKVLSSSEGDSRLDNSFILSIFFKSLSSKMIVEKMLGVSQNISYSGCKTEAAKRKKFNKVKNSLESEFNKLGTLHFINKALEIFNLNLEDIVKKNNLKLEEEIKHIVVGQHVEEKFFSENLNNDELDKIEDINKSIETVNSLKNRILELEKSMLDARYKIKRDCVESKIKIHYDKPIVDIVESFKDLGRNSSKSKMILF